MNFSITNLKKPEHSFILPLMLCLIALGITERTYIIGNLSKNDTWLMATWILVAGLGWCWHLFQKTDPKKRFARFTQTKFELALYEYVLIFFSALFITDKVSLATKSPSSPFPIGFFLLLVIIQSGIYYFVTRSTYMVFENLARNKVEFLISILCVACLITTWTVGSYAIVSNLTLENLEWLLANKTVAQILVFELLAITEMTFFVSYVATQRTAA